MKEKKKFVVDISEQRCWRYEGDKLLNTWRCSTGRNNATKVGRFQVQSKLRKAYGSTWNIWMPWWLGIYWSGPIENGIHGQPWNAKTGQRTWAGLVGSPITYGCVMLNDKAAKTLWKWADIGTVVIIKR
ncbi:MAG TPA: murein L,D-transpeptidase [Anaerolineae bacterium]|nr:murein L,D-transpeptidase [Anaerolineae bacterium]